MTDTDHISFPFEPDEPFMVDHDSFVERCLDGGLLSEGEYEDPIYDGCFPGYAPTCVHEAGHAVAAYVLGRPIESVSAEEWDEDSVFETADGATVYMGFPGGLIRYAEVFDQPLTEEQTEARMYREIITAMAGGYATHRYTGGKPDKAMSDSDRECFISAYHTFCMLNGEVVKPAFELPTESTDWHSLHFRRWCEEKKPPTSQRNLWSEVAHIIDERWYLVEGLAAVLMSCLWLDGPDVYDIFERIEARRAA
jgi:hypothetical protein